MYKDRGVAVIGAHAPEFAFEKNIDDVKKAVAGLKIGYLVALDNDYSLWRAFKNEYWPAHWLVDAQGRMLSRLDDRRSGVLRSERRSRSLAALTGVIMGTTTSAVAYMANVKSRLANFTHTSLVT
jgi:hypothetical protein